MVSLSPSSLATWLRGVLAGALVKVPLPSPPAEMGLWAFGTTCYWCHHLDRHLLCWAPLPGLSSVTWLVFCFILSSLVTESRPPSTGRISSPGGRSIEGHVLFVSESESVSHLVVSDSLRLTLIRHTSTYTSIKLWLDSIHLRPETPDSLATFIDCFHLV